jgi:hypothetical protein
MKEVGEAHPAPWSSVTDPSPHLPAPGGLSKSEVRQEDKFEVITRFYLTFTTGFY